MLSTFKLLWSLFDENQRLKIKKLQILILFLSLFEIITISSVAAFMHLISNIESVISFSVINKVYLYLGESSNSLIFISAVFLMIILSMSTIFSVLGVKRINKVSLDIGRELAVNLFRYYQNKNWLYHTQVNSNWIINRIFVETQRLTLNVLSPFLLMVSRLILVFLIGITLIIYDPLVTIAGAVLFVGGYLIVFRITKPKLSQNSMRISKGNQQRLRHLNEGFGDIKNVILLNKEEYFIQKFEESSVKVMTAQSSNITLSVAPRYIMEWMAYVGMACLVLYLIAIQQKEMNQIIAIITLYGISAFKLLPSLQQIYSYIANIRGNYSVVIELAEDIVESTKIKKCNSIISKIKFMESIRMENINFSYPGKQKSTIKNLTIEIKKNQFLGIVGPSGSGKSTLVDILSGLINIDSGRFIVDNEEIKENLLEWRKSISYVPQNVILTAGSIAENIAFGVDKNNIDIKQVNKAIKQAHLCEFLKQLENGIDTQIGERGVQLSGGQQQRIGIARALYNDNDILIFDEATSALDGITEKLIMDAISKLNGHKTVILIAHRLKTVKNCDQILFINNGELEAQGSYEFLLKNNKFFSKMVMHS
ncbi:ABC transporter ATP-binding protein [Psychromonas arctica]|uniref:ABC transporter ATP-binding protein n=1 Tax=Psychromonas arctica TaxID=168275 RepID=A0ABU9HCW5_9GAMM